MLVLMLLQIVIEDVYYFLLTKFIEECNWLLQMERQIQQHAWGSVCTARVSQQCLHEKLSTNDWKGTTATY